MNVRLIAITQYLSGSGTPEELIEYAGRVCYRSKSRGDPGKFIEARMRERHMSIIEHGSATFEIGGISRVTSHQLVRHRIASFSQTSQRYVEVFDYEWVVPDSIAGNTDTMAAWYELVDKATSTYQWLLALGIPKEDARYALLNATTTQIVVTMNFRTMLHVFRTRISREAQWEIRNVCVRMLELIHPRAPHVFGDLRMELRDKYPHFFEGVVDG